MPAEEKTMSTKQYTCGRYQTKATRFNAKQLIACCALSVSLFGGMAAQGQTPQRDTTVRTLDEVIVRDVRADNKTPLTTTTLDRRTLEENKIASALPYMLELEPSVVTTSENGTVGVTSLRIRGVDATRINVNINGITLNDAESQTVYWYNIPNLGGMSQSVQLQRGVGASNGGSAAFGGAMNLQTLNTAAKPYATADLSWGSWNTRQYGIVAGSGLTKHGFSVDAAYNGLTSDGFVRGGQTDQQSLFVSGSRYTDRSVLKLIAIVGEQHSGITWDGASAEDLDKDPRYNGRGAIVDPYGNVTYYPFETDNYKQQHLQLYYSRLLTDAWTLNAALDYTHGYGYTESYKQGKKIDKYGMDTTAFGFRVSDLIYRKCMENNAYTANLSARYGEGPLTLTFGGSYLYYDGGHHGEIIWLQREADHNGTTLTADKPFANWYSNQADKHDGTLFAKVNYDVNDRLNLYADLPVRFIKYTIVGTDDDYGQIPFDTTYLFFNPKVGANYLLNAEQRLYAVAGLANREPARADIKEAVGYGRQIHTESMLDIELGYQLQKARLQFHANAYAMLYHNQLTPNGLVTESGYALMENVEKSYRIGLELVGGYRLNNYFGLEGNLTLSTNKAVDYVAELMLSDWSGMQTVNLKTTDLALSPSVVGAAILTYNPCQRAKLQLIGKYVGKQYADNTGKDEALLDPYFLLNLRASYRFDMGRGNELECQLAVNNILNHNYRTSAWCSAYYNPETLGLTYERAYFQQPGINFTGRVIYKF